MSDTVPENQNNSDQNHVFPEVQPIRNAPSNGTGYRPIMPEAGNESLPNQSSYQNYPTPTNVTPRPVNDNFEGNPGEGRSQMQPEVYPNQNGYQEVPNFQEYGQGYNPNDVQGQANQSNQNAYFQVGTTTQPQPTKNKDISKPGSFNVKKITDFLYKKWWLVLLVLIAICSMSVGAYVFLNKPAAYGPNDFTNVTAKIDAPQTSPSGSPNRWNITIQNNESVSVQDVQVDLNFDPTFRYNKAINPDPSDPRGNQYKFSSIAANGQGTSQLLIQFEGVLSGNIDEEALMSGQVSYIPSSLQNQPNNRRTIPIAASKTRITAPEIRLEVSSPQQSVQNGGEAEIDIIFENLSERELNNLRLRVNYPDKGGFNYTSSELNITNTQDTKTTPDDGNNTWLISTLPRLKQGSLKIKGIISGAEGIKQTFVAEVAVKQDNNNYQTLATSSRDITVTSQPLVVSTKVLNKDSNAVFSAGETLTIEVQYQNKGNTTLQNVEILGFIDDPANVLDYSTLTFVGGDFQGNINNRVLQWRSNGTSQLATVTPQTSGKLSYSVRVKGNDQFIQSSLNESAYTIRPKAQAKAQNVQQVDFAGDLYKARGDLTFEQSPLIEKKDPNQLNKSTFTITWTLKSRQNKVNDVSIVTTSPLPPTAWQQTSISPASLAGQLNYDSATGRITWKVGNLDSYVGISNPAVSISFDLVIVAPEGKTVSGVTLFNAPSITGIDDFTGEKYQKTGPNTVTGN